MKGISLRSIKLQLIILFFFGFKSDCVSIGVFWKFNIHEIVKNLRDVNVSLVGVELFEVFEIIILGKIL